MAARVNYLLAIRDLLKHSGAVDLPIYLCNSILAPTTYGSLFTGKLGNAYRLKTHVGELVIPIEVAANPGILAHYTSELERALEQTYSFDDFAKRCAVAGLDTTVSENLHKALFKKLSDLHASGRDRIWPQL